MGRFYESGMRKAPVVGTGAFRCGVSRPEVDRQAFLAALRAGALRDGASSAPALASGRLPGRGLAGSRLRAGAFRAVVLRAVVLRAADATGAFLAVALRAVVLRAVVLRAVVFLAAVFARGGLPAVVLRAAVFLAVVLRAVVFLAVVLRAAVFAGRGLAGSGLAGRCLARRSLASRSLLGGGLARPWSCARCVLRAGAFFAAALRVGRLARCRFTRGHGRLAGWCVAHARTSCGCCRWNRSARGRVRASLERGPACMPDMLGTSVSELCTMCTSRDAGFSSCLRRPCRASTSRSVATSSRALRSRPSARRSATATAARPRGRTHRPRTPTPPLTMDKRSDVHCATRLERT